MGELEKQSNSTPNTIITRTITVIGLGAPVVEIRKHYLRSEKNSDLDDKAKLMKRGGEFGDDEYSNYEIAEASENAAKAQKEADELRNELIETSRKGDEALSGTLEYLDAVGINSTTERIAGISENYGSWYDFYRSSEKLLLFFEQGMPGFSKQAHGPKNEQVSFSELCAFITIRCQLEDLPLLEKFMALLMETLDAHHFVTSDTYFSYANDWLHDDIIKMIEGDTINHRHLITGEKLLALIGEFEAMQCDLETLIENERRRDAREKGGRGIRFLVDGLIPMGAISLFAGESKTGKSQLMLELAVSSASDVPPDWAGRAVNPIKGNVLLIAGEDSGDIVYELISTMDPDDKAKRLIVRPADPRKISDILSSFNRVQIDLVIIDPLIKYLRGNEDDSDTLSRFFVELETFVQQQKCALIVVHHLRKGGRIKTLNDIAHNIRGSTVITDRSRVVLGVHRRGEKSVLGILSRNGNYLTNIPVKYIDTDPVPLTLDENTMRHIPMDASVPSETETDRNGADIEGLIIALVKDANAEKRRITRTGRNGVFETQHASLDGFTRSQVRTCVDNMIESGTLEVADEGQLRLKGRGEE